MSNYENEQVKFAFMSATNLLHRTIPLCSIFAILHPCIECEWVVS